MKRILSAALVAALLFVHPAFAGATKTVVITSGTSWTTPSDWNATGARIDAIGGGNQWGGNYAGRTTGLSAIGPGHVVAIQIGAANGGIHTGSNTGSTCFNGCTFLQATVGSDSGNVGDVTYLGGAPGTVSTYTQYGGAAGPHGNGLSGPAGGTGDAGYGGVGSTGCGTGGAGNGNPGSEIAPGVGSGGGSCGAGTGGKYGGGGGASGAPGVLVVTYTPIVRVSSGAF